MFKILQLVVLVCIPYSSFCQENLPKFSAVFNSKKNVVQTSWHHKSSHIKTYIIQRSPDNKLWADIALQGISPAIGVKTFYYEDKNIHAGENYYRLKLVSVNGNIEYSLPVMIIVSSPVNNWVMYPVPVKDMLTLRYTGTEKIKGVINVFIQQSSGKIITRFRGSSLYTTIQIPVSNLGKGIYDVRIVVDGDVVWNQRFVK
ncbi:MAG: T9SS type A sorting domain-containing protein [Ferruginibacter sp.]